MKKILFTCFCLLCSVTIYAQFSIQSRLGRSFITYGDFAGMNYAAGLAYDFSTYFTITMDYESITASKTSNIIGGLQSNDSVTVTAAFLSQKTNFSSTTIYNVYDYYDALAILKEKPDRVTCNSLKIGIDFRPFKLKKHEFSLGLKTGISKIVMNRFVSADFVVLNPNTFAENVIIVTQMFSNILDISISPNLKYYYNLSPTLSFGATFNPDYFFYSTDINWNFGIVSRIKLHKPQ